MKIHSRGADNNETSTVKVESDNGQIMLLPSNITDELANQDVVYMQADSNEQIIFEDLVVPTGEVYQCSQCLTTFTNEYSIQKHFSFCNKFNALRSIIPSSSLRKTSSTLDVQPKRHH